MENNWNHWQIMCRIYLIEIFIVVFLSKRVRGSSPPFNTVKHHAPVLFIFFSQVVFLGEKDETFILCWRWTGRGISIENFLLFWNTVCTLYPHKYLTLCKPFIEFCFVSVLSCCHLL